MNYYHESAADRPTDLSIPAEITISKFQLEFEREMVYNPLRKNKARLTNDERAEIMRVLYISNDQYLAELKQLNREERQHMSNVHHRAFKSFFLQGTGLMRKAETLGAPGKNPIDVPARRVVMDNAVFYEISVVHHALLHAGREKTWFEIQRTCYGINREEVQWFTTYCKTCLENRSVTTQGELNPIDSTRPGQRVQIDLIDMRSRWMSEGDRIIGGVVATTI